MKLKECFTSKRLLIYIIGLFIYAYGVCLMSQANVGISPISSVPYLFTKLIPVSLGVTQFIWNLILIAFQTVWLRRDFDKLQYLQIVASLLFSVFLDLLMPLARLFASDILWHQIIMFIAALLVMAIGLGTTVSADLVIIPGDGTASAIAKKTGWVFGKAKVTIDLICVLITCILSIIFFRTPLAVVQVGTIVAALCLGNIVRLYSRVALRPLTRFMRIAVAEESHDVTH